MPIHTNGVGVVDEQAARLATAFPAVKPPKDLEQEPRDVFPMPEVEHQGRPASSLDQVRMGDLDVTPQQIHAVMARTLDAETKGMLGILAGLLGG